MDIHSHILWGFDDGPSEVAASLELAAAYRELGYTTVAATPHHNHQMFRQPSWSDLQDRAWELEEMLGGDGPKLVPAAEIMFDASVWDALVAGDYPRLGDGPTHLVEFPTNPGGVPMGIEETIFKLQLKDIAIVLAHCERYADLQANPNLVKAIRQGGGLVQINLMSLIGRYGEAHKKASWSMLEMGLVDIVATDLHNPRDAFRVKEALVELHAWSPEQFVRLASENPRLVLEGAPWEIDRDDQ